MEIDGFSAFKSRPRACDSQLEDGVKHHSPKLRNFGEGLSEDDRQLIRSWYYGLAKSQIFAVTRFQQQEFGYGVVALDGSLNGRSHGGR